MFRKGVETVQPHKKIYAMYKGENCLAIGTQREIARQLNMTLDSVRYCRTPRNQRRNTGGNRKILISIEDEGE